MVFRHRVGIRLPGEQGGPAIRRAIFVPCIALCIRPGGADSAGSDPSPNLAEAQRTQTRIDRRITHARHESGWQSLCAISWDVGRYYRVDPGVAAAADRLRRSALDA